MPADITVSEIWKISICHRVNNGTMFNCWHWAYDQPMDLTKLWIVGVWPLNEIASAFSWTRWEWTARPWGANFECVYGPNKGTVYENNPHVKPTQTSPEGVWDMPWTLAGRMVMYAEGPRGWIHGRKYCTPMNKQYWDAEHQVFSYRPDDAACAKATEWMGPKQLQWQGTLVGAQCVVWSRRWQDFSYVRYIAFDGTPSVWRRRAPIYPGQPRTHW